MTLQCVILGAGAPHQGNNPSLLEQVNGMSVLDWLLNALELPEEQIQLVLGYQSAPIAERYQGIRTLTNGQWQSTGSTASLFEADLSDISQLLVCYGDILFRSKTVNLLIQADADIAIAWDSCWQQRYVDRDFTDMEAHEKVKVGDEQVLRLGYDIPIDWADGEFIGLIHFSGRALDAVRQLQKAAPESLKQLHLSGLIEWLRTEGFVVRGCNVAGDWAEVNQPKDIAHFVLGTKAETLSRLRQMIRFAEIQDQVAFTVGQWQSDNEQVLDAVRGRFADQLVVRSSARSEDGFTHSNAGAYTSLLNIDVNTNLAQAIETVIASYVDPQTEDQVLIQPMIRDVWMSGVAFTRTLEHGAPYYVINYDESSSTDGITAGSSAEHQTLFVRRDANFGQLADQRLRPLVKALKEIEELLAYDALDVEFAIDRHKKVHILQVRPIAVEQLASQHSADIVQLLQQAEQDWHRMQQPDPHLLGQQSLYGVMPDWNPAEIIGTHPGRMAESLYRDLILTEVWATQRAEYGYRDVRPKSLLVSFAGKPYVDVRASFNTFIPAVLPDALAERLVDFCVAWLKQNPHLHDKVEFDVIPTCYGLDFGRWQARLLETGDFGMPDIMLLREALKCITCHAIERTASDLENLQGLEARYTQLNQDLPQGIKQPLYRARQFLDACRLYGTLPFAHLARSAFVAMTLLKEAVHKGVLSEVAQEQFLSSVRTVSHELNQDARAVSEGQMEWPIFVERYGHLRPGTYDIASPAYHDDPENYLRPLLVSAGPHLTSSTDMTLWDQEKPTFFNAVRAAGMNFSDDALEQFLHSAIEGREKAKFVFTRSLSRALDLIAHWGNTQGLSREDLANLSIEDLFDNGKPLTINDDTIAKLLERAHHNQLRRQLSMACELPALITSNADFYSFLQLIGQPNYIGSKRVIADCIDLEGITTDRVEVSGQIVLIPQADPGYDLLFGRQIAGLITMYGGANSHMAIRAAEFGLPAAIGIGEQRYRHLASARVIELDPGNAILRAVQ